MISRSYRAFIEDNKNSKSGKTISLTKELWLFVNNKEIKIISKCQKSDETIEIKAVGEYEFNGNIFRVAQFDDKEFNYPKDSDFKALISTNELNFTLRYRRDGDFIQPLGFSGTQKLKKYFNEKKIPNYRKDFIPLLCKDNEVYWVAGIGLSEKIKVKDKPDYVIELIQTT